MQTKQYLGQLTRLNRTIENKLAEIYQLRCMASNVSASNKSDINVQRTRNMDKLGTVVAKIVDLENQTDDLVDKFIEKRNLIIGQIDSIENTDHYHILTLRFVQGKRMVDIDKQMKYSSSQTKRLLNNAMTEFEDLFGSSYL